MKSSYKSKEMLPKVLMCIFALVFGWLTVSSGHAEDLSKAANPTGRITPVATADAGPDQTVCSALGTSVMAASAPLLVGTGLWTQVSGPSTALLVTPILNVTPVTGLTTPGTYVFEWTTNNGGTITSDRMNIVVSAPPGLAFAGPDQALCVGTASTTMAGNTPASGTGTWTQVLGPVTAGISAPNSPVSAITGLTAPGVYTFQWTISSNPCLATFDLMSIVVTPMPTTANAGPDQTVCSTLGTSIMAANASLLVGTGLWTQVSGPSTAILVTPILNITPVTGLTTPGTYVFEWTTSNGGCTTSDRMNIVVNTPPSLAFAGPDQSLCVGTTGTTMAANTPASGTGTWTQVLGPVTAGISAPNSPASPITGLTMPGIYTFQWTISNDPCLPAFDLVSIVIMPEPTAASAGPDQTICSTLGTTIMAADLPLLGTGYWTQVSGPAAAIFVTPILNVTPVTNLFTPGTYVFEWTVTNGVCPPTSDQITITVNQQPPLISAGIDQTTCSNNNIYLAADTSLLGVVAWTQLTGPVGAVIDAPLSAETVVSGLVQVGTYGFQVSVSVEGCLPSVDIVNITVDALPTTADAGPDQTICSTLGTTIMAANSPLIGAGHWTQVSGPAAAIIATPVLNITPVTNLFTPGTYVFEWTIGNGVCPGSSDQVTITVNQQPALISAGIDQTICNNNIMLAADTSLLGVVAWTQLTGPAGAVIDAPLSAQTTVSGLVQAGTYSFQASVSVAGCLPSVDIVNITVNPLPTVANAGPDQSMCETAAHAILAANIPLIGNGTWSQAGGPVTAGITVPSSPITPVTGLTAAGTYTFVWTIHNSPCAPSSDTMQITLFAQPQIAHAGLDLSICTGSPVNMTATVPAIGTGLWVQTSGPVSATIDIPSSATSTLSGVTVAGTYIFEWIISNGVCASSADQVNITVNDNTTTANAGADQVVCATVTTASLNANTATAGNGHWTQVSGPASTIATPASPTTSITGLTTAGVYIYEWAISNGICAPSTDRVSIVVNEMPSAAFAGSDLSVCAGNGTANMAANVPAIGTGAWTQISGPACTIANPALPATGITGLNAAGTYVFEWSVSNGACASSADQVSIVVNENPTTASAGADQALCETSTSTSLNATAAVVGNGTWTQLSGPASTIVNATLPATGITGLNTAGTYVFEWSVSNGACASSADQVSIVMNENPTTASAGADQALCETTTSTSLNATAAVVGNGTWIQVSGPSSTIVNATLPATGITGLNTVGTYVFEWSISNGACASSTDQMSIVVNENPSAANAGADQALCATANSISLNATAAVTGNGTWIQVSGPSSTIMNSNMPATNVTGLNAAGTYVFEWTISNGSCASSTDQVAVIVNDIPTVATAGPDQSACATTGTITMAANVPANGNGVWAQISGPSTAGFVNASLANTPAAGLTIPGAYVFEWTISNAPCASSNDQMTVVISEAPSAANAGMDQTICSTNGQVMLTANTPSFGTASWSQVSGPAAMIASASNDTTKITGLSVSGTYVFEWEISNGTCASSTDQVSISVAAPVTANAGADLTACVTTGTAIMAAVAPANGTSAWSQVSGPAAASIDTITSATAELSGLTEGNYLFVWTVGNAACGTSTDTVAVTVDTTACVPPTDTASAVSQPGLTIPSGFSPNGDGTNDVLQILGLESYPDNTFTVLNRWGNKVFEGAPYNNSWDGNNHGGFSIGGDKLPVGTYFYILELGNGKAPLKGYIYLNR